MKTSSENRRKQSNRRSGFDRRWITSTYTGSERRNGTDRRGGQDRRHSTPGIVPLEKTLSGSRDQRVPALPQPDEPSDGPKP